MKKRKGLLLAGGNGTRLFPATRSISKQLLPIFDKPMIYYPITTLMLSGITEILVITTPRDLAGFKQLLGNGAQWGIEIEYAEQLEPKGIAEAFLIGEKYIAGHQVALILGDNLFYASNLKEILRRASTRNSGATIFGYNVKNPSDYGVVNFNQAGLVASIEEKPRNPGSRYAVTGLYFYDEMAPEFAKELKISARGELEISDLNNKYLEIDSLNLEIFPPGTAWLDTGQPEQLLDAANFVRIVEERQGLKIGCPEEVAFRTDLIDIDQLKKITSALPETSYGKYLTSIIQGVEFENN